VFYCEDGEALENTIRERSAPFNMTTNCNSLIAVASDQTQPVQTVAGNEQVRNYFLSKNSGAATNFSYEIIRHYMHPDYRRDMIAAKRASQEIEPYAYEEYLERVRLYAPKKPFYSRSPWRKTGAGEVMVIKDFLKDCVFPMESQYFHEIVSDVITLTSPDELPTNEEYGFLPLTLKNAVALLEQAGYQYHTIHCLFCRSADETSPAVPLTRKKPRWRRFLSFQTGRRPTGQNGSPRLCRRLFANRPK
jgi:hypothetical protein